MRALAYCSPLQSARRRQAGRRARVHVWVTCNIRIGLNLKVREIDLGAFLVRPQSTCRAPQQTLSFSPVHAVLKKAVAHGRDEVA